MSQHPRCGRCNVEIGFHDRLVRVDERVRIVTETIEGHPAATEMTTAFAGVYCSLVCANYALDEERQRRTAIGV